MKIVNVIGGLGNQMFQYAFACYLQYRFLNEDIFLDTHHFGNYKLHNGYELNQVFPNLTIPIAGKEEVKRVTRYIPHYKLSRLVRKILPRLKTEYVEPAANYLFDEQVGKVSGNCYYEGYWQAIPYYLPIRDRLLHEFTFPAPNAYNAKLVQEIENSQSVGIHIRRGDYLKEPAFLGICDLDYYQRAISRLLAEDQARTFYIFSNDIAWCKENIQPLLQGAKVCYVVENTGRDSCWDMFLMSRCRSLVIANSSFSWWGAFLNQQANGIIAPRQWVNGKDSRNLCMREWILI